MTNPLDLNLSDLIDVSIRALSDRTDPLISRVNDGGTLTNAETKQVLIDLYKLTSIMKTSAVALDEANKEIKTRDIEIALMKVLLGLDDSQKSEK